LGKATIRERAGKGDRKAIDALIAIIDPIAATVGNVTSIKTPLGSLDFGIIKTVPTTLKTYRKWMKGGEIDELRLNTLISLIKIYRKQITKLRKQIEIFDKDLEKEGKKTINEFCKDKTLQPYMFKFLSNWL
jgi:hypothetical protein